MKNLPLGTDNFGRDTLKELVSACGTSIRIGLIAGTVHPIQTVELFWTLDRIGYDGVIYFDTFPDHGGMDPVQESRANLALTERLRAVAATLKDDPALTAAMSAQDAAAAMRIIARQLYGA